MKKILLSMCWLFVLAAPGVNAGTSEAALQMYTRTNHSLNGEWKIIVDPYENGFYNYRYEAFDQQEKVSVNAYFTESKMKHPGDLVEYDFDKAASLQVPGDWNTQSERLYYYEGSVWYRKKFDAPVTAKSDRTFIHFGAVNYRADVYLNGKKLGVHLGGFTPFHYEVTGKLNAKDNSLILKVDNKRHADGVPTLNTDWWNYGGITRDVNLVIVPKKFIRDFSVSLTSHTEKILAVNILLDGAKGGEQIRIVLPELNVNQRVNVDENGHASANIPVPDAQLWSPENPALYNIQFMADNDTLTDKIGLRTIATEGKKVLLNGESVFLRGIAIHEEYSADGGGRVRNAQEAKQLLLWAKSLNANFVRLAHYPHNEHIVRLADEMGLMVWSEIPVYWTINWTNEATYQNAEDQLSAMINRDKNRAAVVIWSLANETPVSEPRNRFLAQLVKRARSLDDSRLLSAAMEKHYRTDNPNIAVVEDPLADLVDMVSFNQYIGWYDGPPEKAERVTWEIAYDKPVFISEFGGGARQGYHGNVGDIWTEEFQENLYVKSLAMLDKIDGYVGTSPWILTDFRSPRRHLNGIQDDYNRKGLLSEKGVKKKAFFVLRDYYQKKADEQTNTAN